MKTLGVGEYMCSSSLSLSMALGCGGGQRRGRLPVECRYKMYRGADKSLARSERKQARKHVREARDFNNTETRAVIKFFF